MIDLGNKYHSLKFVLVAFVSGLSLNIVYAVNNQIHFTSPNIILFIGVLFIILGNYFKTIRPNYFIGIRTPWTLENESIWKETHRVGGIIWLVGGVVIILASMIIERQWSFIIFISITTIIVIIPVVYSFILFKRGNNDSVKAI